MQKLRRSEPRSVHAGRRWLRLLAVPAAVLGTGAVLQAPASASGLYPAGSTGYDVSYPNCSSPLPSGDSFAIVGMGGGRPFTTNSCATSEWTAAEAATGNVPSLYFNTGYAGAYARNIDATCQAEAAAPAVQNLFAGLKPHAASQGQRAWEMGCSEADYADLNRPAGAPIMWWADVELGNSWSTNTQLNQFTLDGMSYRMEALGGGGFYSTPNSWTSIAGSLGFQPTPAPAGYWVAGVSCTQTTVGATPPMLTQNGVTTVDSDQGC